MQRLFLSMGSLPPHVVAIANLSVEEGIEGLLASLAQRVQVVAPAGDFFSEGIECLFISPSLYYAMMGQDPGCVATAVRTIAQGYGESLRDYSVVIWDSHFGDDFIKRLHQELRQYGVRLGGITHNAEIWIVVDTSE